MWKSFCDDAVVDASRLLVDCIFGGGLTLFYLSGRIRQRCCCRSFEQIARGESGAHQSLQLQESMAVRVAGHWPPGHAPQTCTAPAPAGTLPEACHSSGPQLCAGLAAAATHLTTQRVPYYLLHACRGRGTWQPRSLRSSSGMFREGRASGKIQRQP